MTLLFVLLLVIVVAIFAMIINALFRRLNRWNMPFEYVNKRYQGQFFRGFLVSRPKLWFNYGGANVRVQNRKGFRRGLRTTELTIRWKDRRTLRFEITNESNVSRVRHLGPWALHGKTVALPVKELDEKFQVHTNKPEIMEKLLTVAACWQINQLASTSYDGTILISLRKGQLKITRPGWATSLEQLDDFIRFSLELFDRFQLAECEGINFVNEDEVGVVESAVCPICSEKIEYEMVVCVRCKTPHCLDCWHYNGQCATFACDEKRYVRAG